MHIYNIKLVIFISLCYTAVIEFHKENPSMQANQEIFMLVAEEMSISKAAQRAFVSQQCVSDHIKRMEQHYGVQLFTRKPRFQLTEAGHSMLQSVRKIQAIESNLEDTLAKHACGIKGSFTMGISASRAQIILPLVMPEYCRAFPDVEIRFFMNDTVVLEENLRKGNLDLFLGVNTRYSDDLSFCPLCEDPLRFIISEGLLRQYFGSKAGRFPGSEIDLREFSAIPFIKSYSTSVMNLMLQEYLDEHHIHLSSPYLLSDTDTQISLCAKGVGAGFAPHMLSSRIQSHNKSCPREEYLHILPVKDFHKALRIDLVSLGYIEKPLYIRTFENMIVKAFQANINH